MSESRKSILAVFFRKKRLAAGLTQQDVASYLGYTNSQFISNWERGASSPPLKVVKKLIKLYRLDPHEVMSVLVKDHVRYLEALLKVESKIGL